MQAINVHSVIRKQPKKYRKSTPERTAENVLKRDFNASSPNEKWVTDVTEFKWYEGPVCHKLYLSAILDLYDRSVVSHVISLLTPDEASERAANYRDELYDPDLLK